MLSDARSQETVQMLAAAQLAFFVADRHKIQRFLPDCRHRKEYNLVQTCEKLHRFINNRTPALFLSTYVTGRTCQFLSVANRFCSGIITSSCHVFNNAWRLRG